jgi:hypothetical protein
MVMIDCAGSHNQVTQVTDREALATGHQCGWYTNYLRPGLWCIDRIEEAQVALSGLDRVATAVVEVDDLRRLRRN